MALIGDIEADYALIYGAGRFIGGLIPHVTMEELHRDGLIITQHPVERGTVITDHAFTRPAEVDMRIGFSNSSAGDVGYARDVYEQLRRIKDARQPFDVATGKRLYSRMLIAELGVTTEGRSENILLCSVRLQQITITSTQTTSGGAQTGTGTNTAKPNVSESQQSNPASTASVVDRGVQPSPEVRPYSFAAGYNVGVYGEGQGTFATVGGVVPGTAPLDGVSPPTAYYSPGADSAAVTNAAPASSPVIDIGVPAFNPFGA